MEKYLGTKPGEQTGEGFAFLAIPAIIAAIKAVALGAAGGLGAAATKAIVDKVRGT